MASFYTEELINACWSKVQIALSNYRRGVGHKMDLLDAETALREFRKMDLSELTDPNEQKAFWINLYHIYTIYLILKLEIRNKVIDKPWIFFLPKISVGKYRFSLDDIEHGILRSNKRPIYGVLPQFLPWDSRRKLVCPTLDYRIHFVLYCGARSCPAIQIYKADGLDTTLDHAEFQFASNNFLIDTNKKIITANAIFSWYKQDFKGIYLNDPSYRKYKVKINRYDWSLAL